MQRGHNYRETALKTAEAIKSLAALSQETRLGIYRLLVQQGPEGLAVGTIAERMDVAGATLSFHLKELAHADLVTARQDGRFIYYAANYAAMNELMAYLTENCCQGQGCLVDCKPQRQPQRKRA
jgi:DNA-binding transcriptional ArsR family regulator